MRWERILSRPALHVNPNGLGINELWSSASSAHWEMLASQRVSVLLLRNLRRRGQAGWVYGGYSRVAGKASVVVVVDVGSEKARRQYLAGWSGRDLVEQMLNSWAMSFGREMNFGKSSDLFATGLCSRSRLGRLGRELWRPSQTYR